MIHSTLLTGILCLTTVAQAQCPYANVANLASRASSSGSSREHLSAFDIDDSDGYMTSDVGGAFTDQESLKAGERGPTLLEDFIFRQKITHFDHERVSLHSQGRLLI